MSRLLRMFSPIVILVAGAIVAITVSTGAPAVHAAARSGELHVMKECSQDKGLAGDFCTITASNLPELKIGAKVFYDQAAGIPSGLLDSNVVVDGGNGDRALGRCTLDLATGLGLCTFSDGTGQFAGFSARVSVDCTSGCRWDGTYRFRNLT